MDLNHQPGHEQSMGEKPQFLALGYHGSGKLEGKVALVTGGNSGIGRAVAVLYAREGADVAIIYQDEHDDAAETRKFVEAEGHRCITIAGDVRDTSFCEQAVKEVALAFGHLDILVNHSAVQRQPDSLPDLSDQHLEDTMRTNIYGYLHMARAALPHLKHGDCIINTIAATGLGGSHYLLNDAASNGAIHAFTQTLAAKLVDRGIRVNAVAPGPAWTPPDDAELAADKAMQVGAGTDLQRPARPEEVSPAYVFLASGICSSHITGIVLPVTGGVA